MDKDGGPGCLFFTNSGTAPGMVFAGALWLALQSARVPISLWGPAGRDPVAARQISWRPTADVRSFSSVSICSWELGRWGGAGLAVARVHELIDEHDQAGENIRPQPTGPFSSVAFLHGVQPTTTRMTCGLYSTQEIHVLRIKCRLHH